MEVQRRNIKFMTRGRLYWIVRQANVYLSPVRKIIYQVKQRELWMFVYGKTHTRKIKKKIMLIRGSRQALYSYLLGRLDSWQQNRKMLEESAIDQGVSEIFRRLGEVIYERSVSDILVAKYTSELRKQFSPRVLTKKLDEMKSISYRKTSSITMLIYAKTYERLKAIGIRDSVIVRFSLMRWTRVLNICGDQKIYNNFHSILRAMALNQGEMIEKLKKKYKRDEKNG